MLRQARLHTGIALAFSQLYQLLLYKENLFQAREKTENIKKTQDHTVNSFLVKGINQTKGERWGYAPQTPTRGMIPLDPQLAK